YDWDALPIAEMPVPSGEIAAVPWRLPICDLLGDVARLRQSGRCTRAAPCRLTIAPAPRHRRRDFCKVMSMLPDGYSDVPAGKLAAVVTCLEMRAPPPGRADPAQAGIALERIARPDAAWYRDLYGRISAEWLWASRLAMA